MSNKHVHLAAVSVSFFTPNNQFCFHWTSAVFSVRAKLRLKFLPHVATIYLLHAEMAKITMDKHVFMWLDKQRTRIWFMREPHMCGAEKQQQRRPHKCPHFANRPDSRHSPMTNLRIDALIADKSHFDDDAVEECVNLGQIFFALQSIVI